MSQSKISKSKYLSEELKLTNMGRSAVDLKKKNKSKMTPAELREFIFGTPIVPEVTEEVETE